MRRNRRRLVLVLVALALLAGCGGGGRGPSIDEAEDIARLQPGDRPVRFRLDTVVSEKTQQFLVETLQWAHTDLGDSGPLTVHVYSDEEHFVTAYTNDFGISVAEARRQLADGQTAFATTGGHMWIYLTNFERRPEAARRLTIFHEYVHTLQTWQAEIRFQSTEPQERSFMPRWIVEGCAEYLAVRAGAARGWVEQAKQRELVVSRAKDAAEPLEAFETAGQARFRGGAGEAYTVGWLACERLASTSGHAAVAHGFWLSLAKLRDWRPAFAEALGQTPESFYPAFETYRATL